ncbi:MAG TPA: DUF1587 domain-containing protein, partial [Pirellulales bacterium]|nr:DUF1587 domain-containing protein [Pirellulales bacterium]
MPLRFALAAVWLAGWFVSAAAAAEPSEAAPKRDFAETVQPFLQKYCLDCHGQAKQEAKLDLSGYASPAAVAKRHRVWELVLERLAAQEMPPEDAPQQPAVEERARVVAWIKAMRDEEARRHAGDPGPVLARRLSNAEFDYTIRDLTGVDIRPTREFPVDPANEAGFDNSGESLSMSPALAKKYLAAARSVADHLVLKPQGFVFASHPAVTETDRDKYCVQRIIDFYRRHPIDYADYFLAAWRFRHRGAFGKPEASLADFAANAGLSPKYLATIWSALSEGEPVLGPLGALQTTWRELPPEAARQDEARRGCEQMRDLVVRVRKEYPPREEPLKVEGISPGSQPLVLWRNRRLAAQHTHYAAGDAVAEPSFPAPEEGPDKERFEAALERFCNVFPDVFVVSDRGPYFDPKGAGQGRLLTAGFHLMQG